MEPKSRCETGKAASPAGMLQGLQAHQHCGVIDPGACFGGSHLSQVTFSGSLHATAPRSLHLLPFTHYPHAGGVRTQSFPQMFPRLFYSELEDVSTWEFLPKKGFPSHPVQTAQKCVNNAAKCWYVVLNVTIQTHGSRNEKLTTKCNTWEPKDTHTSTNTRTNHQINRGKSKQLDLMFSHKRLPQRHELREGAPLQRATSEPVSLAL